MKESGGFSRIQSKKKEKEKSMQARGGPASGACAAAM